MCLFINIKEHGERKCLHYIHIFVCIAISVISIFGLGGYSRSRFEYIIGSNLKKQPIRFKIITIIFINL